VPDQRSGRCPLGREPLATKLATDYPNSANAKLDIPPITLSASKPYAILTFWHWYYMETNYDAKRQGVRRRGTTWEVVTPFAGTTVPPGRRTRGSPASLALRVPQQLLAEEMFDLSAYAGETVMIRFHFGSDPAS